MGKKAGKNLQRIQDSYEKMFEDQDLSMKELAHYFKKRMKEQETIPRLWGDRNYGKDIEHLLLTAHYHLGYTYFLKNEWQLSSENITVFIERSIPSRFKPYSCFQLGFCYWMLGEKDKIPELYNKVDEWIRPNQSYDEFAKKKNIKVLGN